MKYCSDRMAFLRGHSLYIFLLLQVPAHQYMALSPGPILLYLLHLESDECMNYFLFFLSISFVVWVDELSNIDKHCLYLCVTGYGQIGSLRQGQKKGRCAILLSLKGKCRHCKRKQHLCLHS
jgi:hypothetical protein